MLPNPGARRRRPRAYAGLDHFVNAGGTFIAIGLGVLVGNAIVLRSKAFSR